MEIAPPLEFDVGDFGIVHHLLALRPVGAGQVRTLVYHPAGHGNRAFHELVWTLLKALDLLERLGFVELSDVAPRVLRLAVSVMSINED